MIEGMVVVLSIVNRVLFLYITPFDFTFIIPSANIGRRALKWRNWQTRWTQNPVRLTPGVGSIPTFSTTVGSSLKSY